MVPKFILQSKKISYTFSIHNDVIRLSTGTFKTNPLPAFYIMLENFPLIYSERMNFKIMELKEKALQIT
jgi:hypothetical protein